MPEQHFLTPRPVRLDVTVAAGQLQITTVDGDESTVTLDGSERLLETTRVELVGDRLVIEQRHKSLMSMFGRFDESLRVEARVPHDSKVNVTTASGHTSLEGSFSGLDLKSASGGFRVTGEIVGDAELKSVSGDLNVGHVTGDLSAKTVSGDTSADAVDGSVLMQSVSGNLRVGAVREGRVTVNSVSGNVELGIAEGTSIDVDAGTASGTLSSEVPLSNTAETDTPGAETDRTVVIRSKTVSGDFRVFRAV
jgi:DUF4097 and DUF4098 domain-containing protein YvlB